MKSKMLVVTFIVIILSVGIGFTLKDTCFGKENVPTFLQHRLEKMGIQSIEIKHEKTMNNKYVFIFTYIDKNFSQSIGFSTFEIESLNRYKFEKFTGNNFNMNQGSLLTTDKNRNIKNYWVLYGVIADGMKNKYKVTYSGKTEIEEFPRNEFFVKYYDSDSVGMESVGNSD